MGIVDIGAAMATNTIGDMAAETEVVRAMATDTMRDMAAETEVERAMAIGGAPATIAITTMPESRSWSLGTVRWVESCHLSRRVKVPATKVHATRAHRATKVHHAHRAHHAPEAPNASARNG